MMNKKLTLAAIVLGLAGWAAAQTVVYTPNRKVTDQGISLTGWGSGTIAETDEIAFDGAWSIRVVTRNFFQGGIVRFERPVDLGASFADKNNMLQFAFRVPEGGVTVGPRGGAGRPPVGGPPRGGFGQGGDDEGTVGAAGGSPVTLATAQPGTLRNLRLIVTTSDGLKSEAYINVRSSVSNQPWRNIAIPLSAIRGFERTNKQIQSIAMAGDATTAFYVGDMKIVSDSTPITGEIRPADELNLALNDEREFQGFGFAGASVLRYTWDFDDKDGVQVDAEGQVIRRRFRTPGTFNVTLTINDLYGIKAPISKKVKVVVNP